MEPKKKREKGERNWNIFWACDFIKATSLPRKKKLILLSDLVLLKELVLQVHTAILDL